MISFILKAVIFIILLIIIVNNWGAVVDLFNGVVDWIVYYMKIISAGPPT